MARMTGGEAIVKALAREGVQVAFGLPGVQLYGIVTAFRDEPLRFITVRHEGSSSYMADGYARAGGGIGVAVAVPGPGLLNASAGLNTAYSASSPVLMIAGQIPRNQIGKKIGVLHELDNQLDALAGCTKWRSSIREVVDAPRIVHEAFGQLRSGRPPTSIERPRCCCAPSAPRSTRAAVSISRVLTRRSPLSPSFSRPASSRRR